MATRNSRATESSRREAIRRVARLHRLIVAGVTMSKRIALRIELAAISAYRKGDDPVIAAVRVLDSSNLVDDLTKLAVSAALMALMDTKKKASGVGIKASLIDDAVGTYANKLNLSDADLDKLDAEFKAQSFRFKDGASTAISRGLTKEMQDITRENLHVSAGVKRLRDKFDALGISPRNSFHLETLYRTQTQLAYSGAQYQANQNEILQEILWGYEYVTVGDDRVRPEHEALDGTTAPKDDPIWKKIWTPNGWCCRCQIIELFEPPEGGIRLPPETAEIPDVPRPVIPGPDKGWGFNPGTLISRTKELMRDSIVAPRVPDVKVVAPKVKTGKPGRVIAPDEAESYLTKVVSTDEWDVWASDSTNILEAMGGSTAKTLEEASGKTIAELRSIGERIQGLAESHIIEPQGGVLWRGESFGSMDEVLVKYKRGKVLTFDKLTAATPEKYVAEAYAESQVDAAVKVVVQIGSKTGRFVGIQTSPWSGPSAEVVLPRGAAYRVASVDALPDGKVLVRLYSSGGTPVGLPVLKPGVFGTLEPTAVVRPIKLPVQKPVKLTPYDKAMKKLNALPAGDIPGSVATPFKNDVFAWGTKPYDGWLRRLAGESADLEKLPVEKVRLTKSKFISTQGGVSKNKVDDIIQGGPYSKFDLPPIVVRYGNKQYIIDGHHRMVADLLKGTREVEVRVLRVGKAPKLKPL